MIGTVSRGVRCPVIRPGDDLAAIVTQSLIAASKGEGGSPIRNGDVVGVTEAVLARAQSNYASVDVIAASVAEKFDCDHLGVIFPILSRNRFSILLRGIAKGVKKITLMLSYPSDEVGNPLFSQELLDRSGVNPWVDTLDEAGYREKFGSVLHPFTGVDYVGYYRELIESCGCEAAIIFSNNPKAILDYAGHVLTCDIHTRMRTARILKEAGVKTVYTLSDILTTPIGESGYNEQYGLLGSNKATEESVKLFPRDTQAFVDKLHALLLKETGKQVEVLVYGDGAFKDPQGKIWELADPVVSPAFTPGLAGVPNEVKFKYLADNQFKHLNGKELEEAMRSYISEKKENLYGKMEAQGTTPRQLTDLIGSLCDLTSGSGDKGTPIVWIQGYFDNYAN